jgi:hypothetical protein
MIKVHGIGIDWFLVVWPEEDEVRQISHGSHVPKQPFLAHNFRERQPNGG